MPVAMPFKEHPKICMPSWAEGGSDSWSEGAKLQTNGIREACSTADYCPLLSIVVHCCPLLPIGVHCCPLLPIVVHLRQDLLYHRLQHTATDWPKCFCIRHLLSIKENICAECHRKSYALQDAKKHFFLYTIRKMRSTAFVPCITLGGLYWAEMGPKNDFLKKMPKKSNLQSETINDPLTHSLTGVGAGRCYRII